MSSGELADDPRILRSQAEFWAKYAADLESEVARLTRERDDLPERIAQSIEADMRVRPLAGHDGIRDAAAIARDALAADRGDEDAS